MKNLILLTLILMAACGADDPGKVSYPPSMPPKDEVPSDKTLLETLEIEIDGETIEMGTRNLYDAEEIKVFYTIPLKISEARDFVYILEACALYGAIAGYSFDEIGVLNGMFKEQGYTRDFLLDPKVERTWYHSDGAIFTLIEVNLQFEFNRPDSTLYTCPDSDGNEVPCKSFMCGAIKGE